MSRTPSDNQGAPEPVSDEEAALNAQAQVVGSLNGPERGSLGASEAHVRAALAGLAKAIESQSDEVSRRWRERVADDVLLVSSPAWSRRQLEDHMPEVIVALCAKMRGWPEIAPQHAAEQHAARAHPQHRWQQGYDVRSLTREWGHLNATLLDFLDCEGQDEGVGQPQALRVARSIVAELILESTSESVSSYSRLLQAEAAARAADMEVVIEELREQERSRGEMLREAAHDLRGSLGLVTGSASLVDHTKMGPADRAEVGRLLRRGVSSLHEMMTDLIDLARLEAGQESVSNRLFDVASVLREMGTSAMPLAQSKGLTLDLEGPGQLHAWGDAGKVRRIAQNLLLNAIKYTSQGGVRFAWAEDGEERWLLLVSDTGPGLSRSPAHPLAQALEEATATSRHVEGRTEGEQSSVGRAASSASNATATATPAAAGSSPSGEAELESLRLNAPSEGIGLAIVKRLCDLLGASLELDAGEGAGSTFRILFPRTPAVAAAMQRPLEDQRLGGEAAITAK